MVLIGNDNKKRLSWPIAKIIELIPGRDGEIRTVRLKTQHGTVIRPVQRIFPLEVQAIANSDKELKEESISVKSTKPEKVLKTNDAIITDLTPSQIINVSLNKPSEIKLADYKFNIPGKIDVLVGAEIFYELLTPGQIYCGDSQLLLQNTVFGYVVSGSVGDELRSFKQRVHFKNDRFEVELPWKRDSDELSDNFNLEKRQLGSPMRKMQSDKVLYSEYLLYFPHQVIIKNESLTTKQKIVFDASACERCVLKEEMGSEKSDEDMELPQATERFIPLESERAKMLNMGPDDVAQPVTVPEEKCLPRALLISADEMC
ncbi:DUF1758 domain-containing protein [Trichonephila clavipes]|nr:DUF1758 domain-containing protein [Trichonephila clavipes]